jgi:hypothetical protein
MYIGWSFSIELWACMQVVSGGSWSPVENFQLLILIRTLDDGIIYSLPTVHTVVFMKGLNCCWNRCKWCHVIIDLYSHMTPFSSSHQEGFCSIFQVEKVLQFILWSESILLKIVYLSLIGLCWHIIGPTCIYRANLKTLTCMKRQSMSSGLWVLVGQEAAAYFSMTSRMGRYLVHVLQVRSCEPFSNMFFLWCYTASSSSVGCAFVLVRKMVHWLVATRDTVS